VVAPTTTAGVTDVMTLVLRVTTATDTARIGATLGVMTRRPDAAMTVVMGLVAVGRTRIAVGTTAGTAGTTGLTSALRALRTESPLSRPVERCSAVYCRSKDMNVLA
jgi:hypothetical protein